MNMAKQANTQEDEHALSFLLESAMISLASPPVFNASRTG